jgi:hydrogenase nickel incorporation protein HypA/HybF
MHEVGLLTGVRQAVERQARTAGATGVEAVGLRVGALAGTTVEALDGAWPLVIAGTLLDGARLEIEWVPAAVWCPTCAAEREIDEFYALTCPSCGTPTGHLLRGKEFAATFADLATGAPADTP